jgi:hypothetical protein
MLCINGYPQDYIDECRTRVDAQLAAYRNLVTTARAQAAGQLASQIADADIDPEEGESQGTNDYNHNPLAAAIRTFEPVFFNNLVLMLDSLFVHRSRMLELKDGNPLNEVRLICQSLLTNNAKLSADKTIKLNPDKSILKHRVGDEIRLAEADFVRLSQAFFAEIERKFLLTEAVEA